MEIKVKFVDGMQNFYIRKVILDILNRNFDTVIECDTPDFLFYSVFGYEHLNYECVRIFWTGENIRPDFNMCDYAIGFDYITYEDRYLRCPLYSIYSEKLELVNNKHLQSDADIEKRDKFCNFIYSNGNAANERDMFYELLSQYKSIDSGGKHKNNIGYFVDDKIAFQSNYKFSIAFENSSTNGYVTEKIIDAFAAGTIPIYWGSPRIAEEFNEKAFVNCHAFDCMGDVIAHVKKIDNDEMLFRNYIKEPALNLDSKEHLDNLEKFLVYIFRQKVEDSYRRLRVVRGEAYQTSYKNMYKNSKMWENSFENKIKNKIAKIKCTHNLIF